MSTKVEEPRNVLAARPAEDRPTKARRNRSWGGISVTAAAALAVGAALGWAGATVLAPPSDALDEDTFATVPVTQGEVGSSTSLNTAVSWTDSPVATNQATGVVTSVDVEAGGEVAQGDLLYTVNLRPVVIGEGSIPAFGFIQSGDSGAHVSQLQRFLAAQGLYSGADDGNFRAATEAAVRAWQRAAGYPVDGVVQAADIVWVPSLPTRVIIDAQTIAPGRTLSAGTGEIFALAAAPEFEIPMTLAQAAQAAQGTAVAITAPDGSTWEGVIARQQPDAESPDTIRALLTAADGGPVCGDACSLVPADGQTLLSSEIITTPTLAGLVVPAAAIRTDADGETYLVTEDGDRVEVTVVQTARGQSLVEGVDAGTVVRIASDG